MEELLSLKWNNHKSTFIHVLGILRDKQLYTDATIACEGKFYSVHKLVLSTCSDYFSAMLDRTNCKNPIIVLKDIKCEDLEALLDYMYLGEVNVRQSDLATLIKAAECLRVKGLAVPDDEPPPPRKTKASENQSRRGDTSGSPPAKRKRRSDVDDGRDDVRPGRPDVRTSSPIHRAKSPSAPTSTPLSPVHNRNTPIRQPTEATVPPSPKTSQHHEDSNTDGTANNSMHNNQAYQSSDHAEPFVKVEMEDGGGGEVETYDLSNEGAFKEEGGDDGATSGGGGGESGGDLSNDLPEFLQQATSNPLQGGTFGHSSFAGSSSFQPGELPGWQGDGSNIGFPHLNFGSTEGSSQQNAPGILPFFAKSISGFRSPSPALLTRDRATRHHQPLSSSGMLCKITADLACTSSSIPAGAVVGDSSFEDLLQDGSMHPSFRYRTASSGGSPILLGDVSRPFNFSVLDMNTAAGNTSNQGAGSYNFKAREPSPPFPFTLLDKSLSCDIIKSLESHPNKTALLQPRDMAKLSPPSGPGSSERHGPVAPSSLVRALRSGVAGLTCDTCGRWASCKAELDRHLRIHTGEKPFKCHLCPYSASVKCNLRTHLKTKHINETK